MVFSKIFPRAFDTTGYPQHLKTPRGDALNKLQSPLPAGLAAATKKRARRRKQDKMVDNCFKPVRFFSPCLAAAPFRSVLFSIAINLSEKKSICQANSRLIDLKYWVSCNANWLRIHSVNPKNRVADLFFLVYC
jgi:hypothetical protein